MKNRISLRSKKMVVRKKVAQSKYKASPQASIPARTVNIMAYESFAW